VFDLPLVKCIHHKFVKHADLTALYMQSIIKKEKTETTFAVKSIIRNKNVKNKSTTTQCNTNLAVQLSALTMISFDLFGLCAQNLPYLLHIQNNDIYRMCLSDAQKHYAAA